jgi:hypothetical protein
MLQLDMSLLTDVMVCLAGLSGISWVPQCMLSDRVSPWMLSYLL